MGDLIKLHMTRNPARGLHLCLQQLVHEATALGLPFVAHAIGVAAEAAREEAARRQEIVDKMSSGG